MPCRGSSRGSWAFRRNVKTVARSRRAPSIAIRRRAPDCVVVPAIGFKMPDPLEAALSRPDVHDARARFGTGRGAGVIMTAACIGTFVLAESGLLDDPSRDDDVVARAAVSETLSRRAARRIEHGREVGAIRYRGCRAGPHGPRALVRAQRVLSSRRSPRSISSSIRGRRSPRTRSTDHLVHADPVVQRFESWARARLRVGFSLDEAAKAVGAEQANARPPHAGRAREARRFRIFRACASSARYIY